MGCLSGFSVQSRPVVYFGNIGAAAVTGRFSECLILVTYEKSE
jgi:hypothetical protein